MSLNTRELAEEVKNMVKDENEEKAREILHKIIIMRGHAKSIFDQIDTEYNRMMNLSIDEIVLQYGKGDVSSQIFIEN